MIYPHDGRLGKILDHYGCGNQIKKTVEELDELRDVLKDALDTDDVVRYGGAIIDELADVLIMCLQLRLFFHTHKVDERINYKLNRQLERMAEEANNG